MTAEIARATISWVLAALLLIPAAVIWTADKVTVWRIQRRGDLD